jgi:hypothetical protein
MGAACSRPNAALACRSAFAALLADLVAELQADLPASVAIGLNHTGDLGLDLLEGLDGHLDYASYTNNWVGRHPPRAWPMDRLMRRVQDAPRTPFVGYNVISGPRGGWTIRRAPSAHAYRGMAVLLVAHGAESLRGFVWPPASGALLTELGDQARLFAALAPTVPAGRLHPHPPTSSPALIATAFRDEAGTVLAVVNRTADRVRGAVDVRGLAPDGRAIQADGGHEVMVEAGRLEGVFSGFEGRFYWLPDGR